LELGFDQGAIGFDQGIIGSADMRTVSIMRVRHTIDAMFFEVKNSFERTSF